MIVRKYTWLGSLAFFLAALASSAYGHGIALDGANGSFTVTGTTSVANAAGNGIRVQNSGGTIGFGDTTVTGATGTGVSLVNNTGSTAFSGLDIDNSATNQDGLVANGGGTLTVSGSGNTIDSGAGASVDLVNTTIGAVGVTFESISMNGGGSAGTPSIRLQNTGAGAFQVTGTGPAGSGGVIQDILASAVVLRNTDGPVSLADMIIEDIGNMGTAAPGHHGIDGRQVDGGLSLDNVTIQRVSDSAIHGEAPGGGSTTWNGLTVTGSTLAFSNRFHVGGEADGGAADEAMMTVEGISGTVQISGNDFDDGPGFVNFFTANSGTLDISIQSNTFDDGRKDLAGVPSVGATGVRVNTTGTIDATIHIGDPNESNGALGNTFTDTGSDAAIIVSGFTAGDNANVDLVISRNTSMVFDHTSPPGLCNTLASCAFDFPNGGIGVESRGSGTFEAIISHNTLVETQNSGGLSTGSLRVDVSGANTEAIVRNNTITRAWDGPLFVRADNTDGNGAQGALLIENNTYESGPIGEPGSGDDLDAHGLANSPSPFLPNRFQVRNGAVLNLTVSNDDMVSHDTFTNPQFDSLDMRINGESVVGTSSTFNVLIQNTEAPEGFTFRNDDDDGTPSELNLSRGVSPDSAATDINDVQAESVLSDNGNTTGGGTPDASVPFSGVNIVTTTPTTPAISF